MSRSQEVAFKMLKLYIIDKKKKNESFTLWELEHYVKERAGTTRIAPGRSVKDWIEDAKERGRIVEIAPLEYYVV